MPKTSPLLNYDFIPTSGSCTSQEELSTEVGIIGVPRTSSKVESNLMIQLGDASEKLFANFKFTKDANEQPILLLHGLS